MYFIHLFSSLFRTTFVCSAIARDAGCMVEKLHTVERTDETHPLHHASNQRCSQVLPFPRLFKMVSVEGSHITKTEPLVSIPCLADTTSFLF